MALSDNFRRRRTVPELLGQTFAAPLGSAGFDRDDLTWRRVSGDRICIVNIEGNQWNAGVHVNFGIFLTAIDIPDLPEEADCHIRFRLEDILPERFHPLALDEREIEDVEGAARIRGRDLPRIRPFLQRQTRLLIDYGLPGLAAFAAWLDIDEITRLMGSRYRDGKLIPQQVTTLLNRWKAEGSPLPYRAVFSPPPPPTGYDSTLLIPLDQGIWLADGGTVSAAAGFHYPTRMAVIRLADGGLFVWSPVALTADLRGLVDALGPVRHLVAPNDLHHVFMSSWTNAYPDAAAHAAPGLRRKRPDIAWASDLGETAAPGWAGEIAQALVRGNRITEEVVFFHEASETVLIADLIQQLPADWYAGWRAVVAQLDRMTAPVPAVPRKFRLAFRDRAAARPAIERVVAWPSRAVVLAHGPVVADETQAFLWRAFDFLLD